MVHEDEAFGHNARDRLRNVRWLGGGSGAGKSTVARHIADAHGLVLYSTDEAMRSHAQRSNPTEHPLLHSFLGMTMDERWLDRSPSVMLETFQWFQGEGFEFILQDLLAIPPDTPIMAEGFRLLPPLVAPLLSAPEQAVWLIPTPGFRRAAFDARGFTWQIAGRTSDPTRALANLLRRDQIFTDQVAAAARELQLLVINVDVGESVESLVERVARLFQLNEAPA